MLDLLNPNGLASGQTPDATGSPPAAPVQDLSWLVRAMQLRNQIVPTAFSSGDVRAVVDVLQDGWGLAKYTPVIKMLQTNAPAVDAVDIALPSADTSVVTALTVQQTAVVAGAQPIEAALLLYTGKSSIQSPSGHLIGIPVANFFIPIQDASGFQTIAWGAIMGRGDAVLTAPPGWGIAVVWNDPTTPPAYTASVLAMVGAIPGQQRAR